MQIQPEELLTHPDPTRADASRSLPQVHVDLAAEVLRRFGEVRFVARGSSMIPTIYPGDVLTVRAPSIDDAREGQVVLSLREGRFSAHRVTRKWREESRLLLATRGDALLNEDPPFEERDLLGCVFSVVRHGKPVDVARVPGPWIRLLGAGVRHSTLLAKALLRLHSLRTRLRNHSSDLVVAANAQVLECM